MGAVLVFCETDGSGVRSASLPALTAGAALAKQSGGDLVSFDMARSYRACGRRRCRS